MYQYKVFNTFIQVFLIIQFSSASFERTAQPTALFGRGLSGSSLFNTGNVWLNPASIAQNTSFNTSLFYSPSPFQLPQLSHFGLVTINNYDKINFAAGFSSFGFSLYRETELSLTTATMFTESFGIGLSFHADHISIQSYGSATRVVVDLGAIISVTDNMNIGMSFNNITRSTFGEDDDIPQIIITGMSFSLLERTTVTLDIVHDVRYSTGCRAGIEFSPIEYLTLRAGTQNEHSRLFGGIGINIFSFIIDYGIATHSELGLTHSLGITFSN